MLAVPNDAGVEELVRFPARPAASEVRYRVELGDAVAGLRLVGRTLEFLDGTGTPRLRIAPPAVVSADHRVYPADLSVNGCAVDTNPAAPWGRAVTAPGARHCEVGVRWDAGQVQYPAVLDPAWTLTGAMVVNRSQQAAVRLGTGEVLAIGGSSSTNAPSTSELYDPASGTWAATGNLTVARSYGHSATLLADGRVLVIGGSSSGTSTEIYDPSTGTWGAAAPTNIAHNQHEAVLLGTGDVLVVSGSASTSIPYTPSAVAEYYVPSLNIWVSIGGLSRYLYSLTVLADGRALLAGGGTWLGTGVNATADAQIFNPSSKTWSPAGTMTSVRMEHSAVLLPSGQVLVAGGYNGAGSLQSAEIFSPSNLSWTAVAPMAFVRTYAPAVLLEGTRVLVVGGTGATAATEIFGLFGECGAGVIAPSHKSTGS